MNLSSSIEISKSSLLSLKAEVLRKQQEISKAKLLQSQHQSQTPLRQKTKDSSSNEPSEPQNKGIEDRRARDEVEDEDILQKSKKMLEAKARLYNRLEKGPSHLTEEEIERNSHYLVQFDRKARDKKKESSDEDEQHFSDEYEPATNPDEEWIEYTDCLGRTRKCMRKDLVYLKEKDRQFSKSIGEERIVNKENTTDEYKRSEKNEESSNEPFQNLSENSEMLSSDMRRELLRQEWEKQEQELLNKNDVHYQDVLFNEARSHGVGYYSFSKDEEERAKQQEELRKLREETSQKQKSSMEQKALREKQLAARLKAARNRKRARMGLPPEEDEQEEPAPVAPVQEDEEEKQKIAKKAAEENAREEARRRLVRPWDIGKEGVKKHYEHTQEEWVDKKRKERPKEFAPPSLYQSEHKPRKIEESTYSEPDKSLFFTTKKSKNKRTREEENKQDFWVDTSIPPPNFVEPVPQSINPYKNKSPSPEIEPFRIFEPTPIDNELSDSDIEENYDVIAEPRTQTKRKGAEIAPPTTFEYYGPSGSKTVKADTSKTSLEESIAIGLRYLREQAEKKEKSAEKRYMDNT